MRHESRSMKEGWHDPKVLAASLAGPHGKCGAHPAAMKRATRASLEAWTGTGLVVVASVMMKVSSYSAARTVVFVVAILVATGLIIRSLGGGRRDEED
jgi:hypothetical protein